MLKRIGTLRISIKKQLLIQVMVLGTLLMFWRPEAVLAASSGTGAAGDPYLVESWSELSDKLQTGGYIKLNSDVTAGANDSALTVGKDVWLDLNGYIIDRGLVEAQARADGNVITVPESVTLNLTDSRPKAVHDRKVSYVNPVRLGDPVIVNGGIITGGNNTRDGGGIYACGGNINMYGGSIAVNRSARGGGVYILTTGNLPAVFNIYGGSICGNKVTETGQGGGIYNNATTNLHGGSVCGNSAPSSAEGAGVFNKNRFCIYGGSINDNSSGGNGAGLCNSSEIYMYGGSITYNSAARGGGICNQGSITDVQLYAGLISNNFASEGGGLYFDQGCQNAFKMMGGVISCNTDSDDSSCNNIYYASKNEDDFRWYSGTIKTGDDQNKDSSKMSGNPTLTNKGNALAIFINDKNSAVKSTKVPTDSYISAAVDKLGTGSNTSYYQLTGDINLSEALSIEGNVYMDLNGHIITGAAGHETISVNGYILTITDSRPEAVHYPGISYTDPVIEDPVYVTGGIITHAGGAYGRGITAKDSSLYMYGGTVCGNRISPQNNEEAAYGGGVFFSAGQSGFIDYNFNMYGSAGICGNRVEANAGGKNKGGGGGIAIAATPATTCAMRINGLVSGNYAKGDFGGGIYAFSYNDDSDENRLYVRLEHSTISNNLLEAGDGPAGGGGLALRTKSVPLGSIYLSYLSSRCRITGNAACSGNNDPVAGGGVYVDKTELTVYEGCSITGNRAESGGTACGGGIYFADSSDSGKSLLLQGGNISGNTAKTVGSGGNAFGGGLALCCDAAGLPASPGKLKVSGNLWISGNTVKKSNSSAEENLYLPVVGGILQKISFDDALSPSARIGVTLEKTPAKFTEPVTFTSGLDGKGTAENFTSDREGFISHKNTTTNEAELAIGLVITGQPGNLELDAGASSGNVLSVTVETLTDAVRTYEWYRCKDINKTDPVLVKKTEASGGNKNSYTVPTKTAGTFYYFCRITIPHTGTNTVSEDSAVATVKITGHEPAPTRVPVTGIMLDKKSLSLECGQEYALKATITPNNATDKTLTWTSSKPKVAAVSKTGVVTAKSGGTAIITAKAADGSGKKVTCSIKVKEYKDIKRVYILPSRLTIKIGNAKTLKAVILPTNARNKGVSWKSSNTKVATVTAVDGKKAKVTAIRKGTAKITVTTLDGKKKKTINVTVRKK
ncbi:MAG: Ig domain-containing protein [Lachnospiraceae bacterium]|nr:Ig domain-containing protein [Lachnospiraceae bacterium]